jgi:ferredoxin-NADP reductase
MLSPFRAGRADACRPKRTEGRPVGPRLIAGSPGFADAASDVLVELGQPVDRIRVERFGPTG